MGCQQYGLVPCFQIFAVAAGEMSRWGVGGGIVWERNCSGRISYIGDGHVLDVGIGLEITILSKR